jgi:hypothetical protein
MLTSICQYKGNVEHALHFALRLSRLFRSALNWTCHSNTRVRLMPSSLNARLIIHGVFLLFRNLHKMWCALAVGPNSKSHQARYTTSERKMLYTDSQDILLSSTVASLYYICCKNGSTSPGNYGWHNFCLKLDRSIQCSANDIVTLTYLTNVNIS